jgi:hypothetical protein
LSEYPIFKNLLLDILNFKNSHGVIFTADDVAKGVKEKFKRHCRINKEKGDSLEPQTSDK